MFVGVYRQKKSRVSRFIKPSIMVAAKITDSGGKNTQPRTARGIKPGILKHRGKNEPNFLSCYPVLFFFLFFVALSVTPVTLPLCISSSKGFLAEWLLRPWLLHGDHAALGTECDGRQSQVSPDDTLPIMNFFAPCM